MPVQHARLLRTFDLMYRTLCLAVLWIAACLWAASAAHAVDDAAASPMVEGQLADPEVPALYRLPQVATVAPPTPPEVAELPTILPCPAEDDVVDNALPATCGHGSCPDRMASAPTLPRIAAALPVPLPQAGGLNAQLLPAVQRGYGLAQRGALFAARTEFVQVLRRVAQARDAATAGDIHSRSLAAGLRALDEANDFVPQGVQLEGELDVRSVASSHRTPVLRQHPGRILPHEAAALYHHFAQWQLAQAVAGEQAGSMALYGLGKIYVLLAAQRDDDVQLVQSAMTMYAAAVDVRPDNHLASNELGVLLCRAGRPAEAARLFERTIDIAPSATAYHNLAVAQRHLGLHDHALANERESQRLAAWERSAGEISRRAGIRWVTPEELARVAQPGPVATAPPESTALLPTTARR
jgi:tetratricopeptide (TPR) repeat protein